jgi:glycosyltransferase involved in cell wall biosynthesis
VALRRALLVTTSFPRDADDFAGRFVAEHAADLTARGWRVRVLAPPGRWTPAGVERLAYPDGGLFAGVGAPERLSAAPLRAAPAAARTLVGLAAALRRHRRPDEHVAAHWLAPCGLLAPGALAYAHGGDVALLERLPAGRALARRIDARAAALAFVSADLRARFHRLLGRAPRCPHRVLPMGVATPAPEPDAMARLRARAAGRRVVSTVGRLMPIKGLDLLPGALAGRDDVIWMAAGDGSERARLEAACAAAGVAFAPLGVLGPGARDALLAVADVFAFPSRALNGRTEGCPVAVMEAVVAGTPVVAARTGGVAEVAGPAGALLVPPDDGAALRAALTGLLDDPARRAAMRRRHRAAGRRLTWSVLGADHAEALRRARPSPP